MGTVQISFGPFVLDRSARTLLLDGKPVAVGQRAFALLDSLAAADGPVDKADLIEAAWSGAVVEEGNLTVQIAALRRALGTRSDGQDWIVTVPRVGYRLLRSEASLPKDDKIARVPSIAVLPFQNLSGDPEQDYFADGVVEDLITAFSRFKSFAVIARNSSFTYKGRAVDVRDVGRELGVRYILEGSVRRSGARLRVTAQLVDAQSGAHIWANKFDGLLADVFDMQDDITAQVAGIVEPSIQQAEIDRARRKPPENLDAYDLMLRGMHKYYSVMPEDNEEAIALYLRAVQLSPDYGPAWSYLAWAVQFRVTMGWPSITSDDMAASLDYTERALALAQGDAAILAQAGVTIGNTHRQYERGVAICRNALEANSNNGLVLSAVAVCFLHLGDLDEAEGLLERALSLSPIDPTSHWTLTAMAHVNMARGRFEEALRWADRSLAVNSKFGCTYWMLIAGNAMLGRTEQASAWLEKFLSIEPSVTLSLIARAQPDRYADRVANIYEGLRRAGLPE
jgi:TolB-like protein/Tfp pilus assembly protein PilF